MDGGGEQRDVPAGDAAAHGAAGGGERDCLGAVAGEVRLAGGWCVWWRGWQLCKVHAVTEETQDYHREADCAWGPPKRDHPYGA